MKLISVKVASVATTVLLSGLAMPSVHAQNLGDIVNQAKHKIEGAKQKADDATNGSPSDDAPRSTGQSKNGGPNARRQSDSDSPDGPSLYVLEKQTRAALRKIAPQNANIIIAGYRPGATPEFRVTYLQQGARGASSGEVKTIPETIRAGFRNMRAADKREHANNFTFEACKVVMTFGIDMHTIDNTEGAFQYFYHAPAEKGMLEKDDVAHYSVFTAPQLLATYRKTVASTQKEQKSYNKGIADYYAQNKRNMAASAKRAGHGPVAWRCTKCHKHFMWPEEPSDTSDGMCVNVNTTHNWVRANK